MLTTFIYFSIKADCFLEHTDYMDWLALIWIFSGLTLTINQLIKYICSLSTLEMNMMTLVQILDEAVYKIMECKGTYIYGRYVSSPKI